MRNYVSYFAVEDYVYIGLRRVVRHFRNKLGPGQDARSRGRQRLAPGESLRDDPPHCMAARFLAHCCNPLLHHGCASAPYHVALLVAVSAPTCCSRRERNHSSIICTIVGRPPAPRGHNKAPHGACADRLPQDTIRLLLVQVRYEQHPYAEQSRRWCRTIILVESRSPSRSPAHAIRS